MKTFPAGLAVTLLLITSAPARALDDPTRPPTPETHPVSAATRPTFSLDSIMLGPTKQVAVIDGVARRQGEVFGDGVTLLRVYPDRVRLRVNGQLRVLHWATEPQVRVSQ